MRTCHVYVDEPWLAQTGPKSQREKSTLRFALNVRALHICCACHPRMASAFVFLKDLQLRAWYLLRNPYD
jgi:ferredoxin